MLFELWGTLGLLSSDRKTVLLVEDNIDDERLLRRALSMNGQGTHLMVARDGAEAIRMLLEEGLTDEDTQILPALILLDLNLPKLSGIEVLRRLRADDRTKSIPIVIMTLSDERSDIVDAYTAGANSYIRKSMNFEEFIDSVRQLEQYWLHTNVALTEPQFTSTAH